MVDLSGYKLTFSDEFNERSISQTGENTTWADIRDWWRFDANSDIGFGASSFVDPASGYDPFNVSNGVLTITAVPDRTEFGYPSSWESGLIHSKESFSQTYGYFEIKADFADERGAWDAFWLLPVEPKDPNNTGLWQEIDIVEHYGAEGNEATYRWIHTTDHTTNGNIERQVTSHNPSQVTGFHTYGMDWQADKISFYFDGEYMGSTVTPSDMHDPMFILANLATESKANEHGSPMTTKIDYIRAYSNDSDAVEVPLNGSGAGSQPTPPVVDASPTPPPVAETPPVQEAPPPVAEAPPTQETPQEASPSNPEPAPTETAGGGGGGSAPVAGEEPAAPPAAEAPPVVEAGGSTTPPPATEAPTGSAGGPVEAPAAPTAPTAPVASAGPEPMPEVPAAPPSAPPVVEAANPGGGANMDAFMALLNNAHDGSYKYIYCSPTSADARGSGADYVSAVSDFLDGRGFGEFRSDGAATQASLDPTVSSLWDQRGSAGDDQGGWSNAYANSGRYASSASEAHHRGERVGDVALDDGDNGQTQHVPVHVDLWSV